MGLGLGLVWVWVWVLTTRGGPGPEGSLRPRTWLGPEAQTLERMSPQAWIQA